MLGMTDFWESICATQNKWGMCNQKLLMRSSKGKTELNERGKYNKE